MTINSQDLGEPGDKAAEATQANSFAIQEKDWALLVLCLLMGPLGMMYVDWKHSFLGLLSLLLFLGGLYIAWPALMPAFLALGFLLTAFRAHTWVRGQAASYRRLSVPGFRSLFNSVPFFLPLLFDLAMLVLLECCLRQAWFNWQRGSVVGAVLIACFSTPIILIGVRGLVKPLVRRALRPFRLE